MSGPGFLERYEAGEHEAVWRELIDLGERALEVPHRSEAMAVSREIVRRARANLGMLHGRLLELGYEFADPAAALVDAGPEDRAAIGEVEEDLGEFPMIARAWYESIASVNFAQAEAQRACWGQVEPPDAPDIFGLASHPVLIFQSLANAREMIRELLAESEELAKSIELVQDEEGADFEEPGKFLPLGAWASNCCPKGFPLPSRGVDAVIYNDGGGDQYFVDELRLAFGWGGFPFWQRALRRPKFYSPMEYRPNFAKLLPVLREGLLDL